MGVPVLILGKSGSGKSYSMREFAKQSPDSVAVYNVDGKLFPFPESLQSFSTSSYTAITSSLKKAAFKTYVIDDSQYLMAFEAFERANETGYKKFTDMALHFYNLIRFIQVGMPADCIVYLLHHTEPDGENSVKAKTQGKMLDSQLTVEGLFSIVLLCEAKEKEHYFITNSDGTNPAKSPVDMFEDKIPNDLKFVDETIRKYYHLDKKED